MKIRLFKPPIIHFLLFLLILFIITFPLFLKMDSVIYGPLYNTDNRSAVWHFWWFNYAHRHHLAVDRDTLVNYPFGMEDMAPTVFPLCMFPAYFLSIAFGEIVAYNLLIILSFIIAFLCAYALTNYLTKNSSAAFVSGLIYSLSPYHVNKSWEHFGLMFIGFIPLYILALLRLKEKQTAGRVVLCSLSLALVALSDLTYDYIIFIFSVFFALFTAYFFIKHKYGLQRSLRFFLSFLLMGLLAAMIALPFLLASLKTDISSSSASSRFIGLEMPARQFHYLFSQSAGVLAYLVPSKYHPFFGGVARALQGSIFYGKGSVEQTLYLGWAGLILSYICVRRRNHADDLQPNSGGPCDGFAKSLLLFTFILAVIFSMPPYWDFLFFKLYFPSFFIYKVFPIFRAYARFGVLALLSVSILAGWGFSRLAAAKNRNRLVVAAIPFLIFFDFLTIPPFRTTDINKSPLVYQWLAEQPGDLTIIEYPLGGEGKAEGGETYLNLDYLLYQRIHQKRLVNGAKPGTPSYDIKLSITKITDPLVPKILRNLGVAYVIIHENVYLKTNEEKTVDIVGEAPDLSKSKDFKLVKKFDADAVYEVLKQ